MKRQNQSFRYLKSKVLPGITMATLLAACGQNATQAPIQTGIEQTKNNGIPVIPSSIEARQNLEIRTLDNLNTTYRGQVNIAIMDSGVDVQHSSLANYIWNNNNETSNSVDDDNNGYVDDIYGWNFVDNNSQPIDQQMMSSFSQDVYRFVEISSKKVRGTATTDEINWANQRRQDSSFVSEVNTFGTYIHGTHVAGIASANSPSSKILTAKLLKAEKYAVASSSVGSGLGNLVGPLLIAFLAYFLIGGGSGSGGGSSGGGSGSAVGYDMSPMFQYARTEQVLVANCSFGVNRTNIAGMIQRNRSSSISALFMNNSINTNSVTDSYIQYLNQQFANDFRNSPNTLFVIAAGNDNTNNDSIAQAPANARTENMISVAASLNNDSLASFSNYGANTVDIAAPGVAIRSTIPGNREIELSGTSMAAPFISNVAARIRAINPNLSPIQTKTILMQTVDVKPFLQGKVISSGVVHPERALTAAELSTTMALDQAIAEAKVRNPNPSTIVSIRTTGILNRGSEPGFVVPMPGNQQQQ